MYNLFMAASYARVLLIVQAIVALCWAIVTESIAAVRRYAMLIDLLARANARAWKSNRAAVGPGGIIGLFISMLVVFYVLGALINPVESGVTTVTNALQNSSFTEVQNIKDLPKVSYLIGLISVIVGLIYIAWGRD